MEILDAQLHCWLPDRPSRPWKPGYRLSLRDRMLNIVLQSSLPMPPETLLVEMAAAGVDGGVLTSQGMYTDFELEMQAALDYPRKFVVMGMLDHMAPDIEDVIDGYLARGMIAARLYGPSEEALRRGDFDRALARLQHHGRAAAFLISFPVGPALHDTFDRYPDIQFMIDHLGVGHAPPAFGLAPEDPWELLPQTLSLARHPNVNVKLTGGAALSREAYPFRDVWGGVLRIIEAYGPERVMWGTDITRTGALHTYLEGTHYLREIKGLTEADLALLYGQSLRRVLKWEPDAYLRGLQTGQAPADRL